MKQKPWNNVVGMGFKSLVDESQDLQEIKRISQNLLAIHDIRNLVYHFGTLTPAPEDVESAMSYAILVFNAFHPEAPFKEPEVTLPSRHALVKMGERPSPYVSHMSMMKKFADYLMRRGYVVEVEVRTPAGYRLDMTARKGKTALVFEFKSGGYGSLFGNRAILEFRGVMSGLKLKNVAKIVPYLVTDTKFTQLAMRMARKAGIGLIQGGDPTTLVLPR